MKKLFTLLVAILATTSIIWATNGIKVKGIYYIFDKNTRTAAVTSCTYPDVYKGKVKIPATIKYENVEYAVNSIGEKAFLNCKDLKSVDMTESIKSIGNSAFANCSILENVSFPFGLTSIGEEAFAYCENLTNADIAGSVKTISKGAFRNCKKLFLFTMSEGIMSIEDNAFSGCSRLGCYVPVVIPNSVTSIGKQAFYFCEKMCGVTIGKNVTTIGEEAFKYCDNISSVVWNAKNFGNSCRSFSHCTKINSFVFGDEVEVIPSNICSRMPLLTSIKIPNSVKSIGEWAFVDCTSVSSVVIGNNVKSIEDWAFSGCTNLTSLKMSYSIEKIGKCAFNNCANLIAVDLLSVKTIGESAFSKCRRLSSVGFSSLTSIGNRAFAECESLETIILPNSLETLGKYAFNECKNLRLLVLGSCNISSIPEAAFCRCYKLDGVNIPESVTSIDFCAFADCTSLSILGIGNNVTTIADQAFAGCKSLTKVILPESIRNVGNSAFFGCTSLIEIRYPNGLVDFSNLKLPASAKLTSYNRTKPIYFSDYAKPYVQKAINEWQKKDEFESLAEWKVRVTETTRAAKIKELTKQCEEDYLNQYAATLKTDVTIGQYDAENQVFLLTDPVYGNMLIPVPAKEGRAFKENWKSAQFTPKYFIENDVPSLSSLDIFIPALNKHYKYSNQASLRYELAQVDYDFEPIEIEKKNATTQPKGQQIISEKKITVGKSEVDAKIPETNIKNENTFVVIFANENYKNVASVPFALNDGRVLAKYCQRTLGIPAANIKVHENATYNDMRLAIAWLKNVCEKYEGEASVIFYYAGHGIPDASDKSAYLLPVDGDGRYVATGYKVDDLYQKLGEMPAKSITVMLDACFSGANRDGKMLASERGVALKTHSGIPQGNMVVFSAAQGDETALPNEEEGHGMFTYYVLKKMQETQGNVTLQDLSQYVIREVGRKSAVSNKPQTPCITPSASVIDVWQNWKLK